MAKSMLRRRQEAKREQDEAYAATLKRVSQTPRQAPDFDKALRDAARGYLGIAIRSADEWRPKLKTRDESRLRLAAARHLYARYPVPAHLEAVWLEPGGLTGDEERLRRRWYIAAARGDSLFKAEAGAWLSRREVHTFLAVGGDISFEQAFWFAIARSHTDDSGLALRIARTRIASRPRGAIAFWRDAVRFFCAQPTTREEIDDLCNFFSAARRRDATYSLKGRTLASLRRQMADWRRDICAIERIEALRRRVLGRRAPGLPAPPLGGRWDGMALEDWQWKPSSTEAEAKDERYVIRQLTSAEDLVYESRAMSHCVATYAARCIAGNASIWVLRRAAAGDIKRLLTIEVDSRYRVVQVRGFANRTALPAERAIVMRWARARGLDLLA